MRKSLKLAALSVSAVTVLAPFQLLSTGTAVAKTHPLTYHQLNALQKRLLSVSVTSHSTARSNGAHPNDIIVGDGGDDDQGDDAPTAGPTSLKPSAYQPSGPNGCSQTKGKDVKVNQNCLNLADPDLQGRGQAQNETSIAINKQNTDQLVGSYNDYRRGDGTCGSSYSTDGGSTWADATVPNGFVRGDNFGAARQYFQAGGDTSVAWDTRGNAYLSCQLFQRGAPTTPNPDLSSAFYVFRSTGNGGASYNFPGRPVRESSDVNGSGTADFLDKQLLTVDDHTSSPYRDRVYVTWTDFTADGTAYIYEAYSSDYGESFSSPVLVSGDTALCGNNYGLPTPNGNCNENQFSQPFTGSDGSLYVAFANFNNVVSGQDNRNQILLAKSTDGGQSFSAPVKATDYYDLPDCATYQNGQDQGRACVPEKSNRHRSVFRATNYPAGAVDPKNPDKVVVTVGSYINRHSNESNGCTPTGFAATGINTYDGVKTKGACNNDILVSTSTDGGATFNGSTTDPRQMHTVTNAKHQRTRDEFWQWAAYNSGGKLQVSYYDRQYGHDESNGSSDISLSSQGHKPSYQVIRVTSSSMPPPTQFSGLFYGDYSGLDAANKVAYPFWSDTRPNDLFACQNNDGTPGVCTGTEPNGLKANDQDAFTSRITTR